MDLLQAKEGVKWSTIVWEKFNVKKNLLVVGHDDN